MTIRLKQPPKISQEDKESLKKYGDIVSEKVVKDFRKKIDEYVVTFSSVKNQNSLEKYLKENNIIYTIDEIKPTLTSKPAQNNNSDVYNLLHHYYKEEGKKILNFEWDDRFNNMFNIEELSENQSFKLTTTYPGLLAGSGYEHPIKVGDNEAFQLGFFFDHTTGLPIISGSSIKGL